MYVAVPREHAAGERRVALTPDAVGRLEPLGLEVLVESGAGDAAALPDAAYREAGATIVDSAAELHEQADIVVRVGPPRVGRGRPSCAGAASSSAGCGRARARSWCRRSCDRRITAFGMESIPRATRAQRMDALSSQATVSGYRSVILAAERCRSSSPC